MGSRSASLWVMGVATAATLVVAVVLRVVAPGHETFDRRGFPDCAPSAILDVLSNEALECWVVEPGWTPWRITSALSAHYVFVVRAEAFDRAVAREIARLVVEQHAEQASEIVVYVHPVDPPSDPAVTRVRWTPARGFESFEFPLPLAPAARPTP